MKKELKGFIFDLDGTLIDSKGDIFLSVNHTLKTLGAPILEEDAIAGFVGDGILALIARSMGTDITTAVEQGLDIFIAHYREHLLDTTCFYPGVCETLDYFAGKKLGIATNKPEDLTRIILKGLQAEERFLSVIGGDTASQKKPSPVPISLCLDQLGLLPYEVCVVGDSFRDIQSAQRAGCMSCGVSYGLGSPEAIKKENPDHMIGCLSELRELFI